MTNPNNKSSDPANYAVRSGLKREFAFALKSRSDLPNSFSRTRSGRVIPTAADSPIRRKKKKLKKPDPIMIPDEKHLVSPIPKHTEEEEVSISCDPRLPSNNIVEVLEKPVVIYRRSVAKDKVDSSPLPLQGLSVVQELVVENGEDKENSRGLENGSEKEGRRVSKFDNGLPMRRFTRSALKVMPVIEAPITIGEEEDTVEVMPVSTTCVKAEMEGNLMEVPVVVDESGGLEFENGDLNWSIKSEIEGFVAVDIAALSEEDNDDDMDLTEDVIPLTKPARKLPENFEMNAIEATVRTNGFECANGDSVVLEDLKAETDDLSGSLSMNSKKKMELKMSKKITPAKLPANVRDLLGTGFLEGLPVKYISCIGKSAGLPGVIRGNGVLCACTLCHGTNVVSAYQFEIHAGSTKKHPSDFIFLENGKSLRTVLKSCTGAPLDMLEAAIRNAVGPLPPKKDYVCQKCKEVFETARTGNFALLCDSCLESNRKPSTPTSSFGVAHSSKFSRKLYVRFTSDAKRSSANGKPFSYDGKLSSSDVKPSSSDVKPYSFDGNPSATDAKLSESDSTLSAFDGKPKNMPSQKKMSHGKLTRKDLGLHKLVFMDDILPQGTEVGYYVRGKRLLEGYIKDSGIFCSCCNTVVSPSQFEAHCGQGSRRKPYNYIYTSNGVSLHELSVSLSKDRKFSPTENDDLCGICADGGNLLLCDLCPRAFHKECVGLPSLPTGNWFCQYCENMRQKERHLSLNDNAIAAGRVAGVDPIEQIITRCIRIITTPENDAGVCALCRQYDFSRSGFDQRTVIICDQCETEYHVGCLKDNGMADLKELPEGEWFCRPDCSRIHSTLHELLLQEPEPLEESDVSIINKKLGEKGLSEDTVDIKWRLLSGKEDSSDSKQLLSQAVTIFRESFDPIVEPISGRDLIPFMVYCLNMRDQDFGGIYCMVLTVNSLVISAGLLRVLGCEVAELPIVATKKESRGLGFFQSLFHCVERLFKSLKVKHFVLPAASEAESMWTKKLGFSKVTPTQLREYAKGVRPLSFQGTSMLHKPLVDQQEMASVSDHATSELPSSPLIS